VEVLERFRSRGVEVIARENRGAHTTINEAIERASQDCDIISILNSDDHYHPERFAKLMPLLEQDPTKMVACSGIHVIDGEDRPIDPALARAKWFRAISSWAERDVTLPEWIGLANFPATTSNVVARSAWLRRFSFRPYHFIHDYYFLLQSVLRDALVRHPDPLVNYRVHATNTINTNPAPLMREMVRMNLDLLHDLAPELPGNPSLRRNLYHYLRASWENVSALHQGLLQAALADCVGRLNEAEIEKIASGLREEDWPELAEFPNKALVNSWDETAPLGAESGLADKFAAQKAELSERKEAQKQWKALAKLQSRLLDSKWLAIGRLCGLRGLRPASLETAQAAEALKNSRWVRLGSKIGSKACKSLLKA
jgi:hypothetical protein